MSASTPNPLFRRLWKLRYSVPPEKGVWVWWIGPFAAGVAAAGRVTWDLLLLLAALLCAFMLRQPLALAMRIHWKGRNRNDLAPALAWLAFYCTVSLTATLLLLRHGHWWVLPMAGVGIPLFAWHLWLVREGEERQQPLMDVLAAAVLALAAPAAYWACGAADPWTPWTAWLLTALQATASVVHVILRLKQRKLKAMPPWRERLLTGAPPMAHHLLNVAVAAACMQQGLADAWVIPAFLVPLAEGAWAVAHPPVRATPMKLGMQQIAVSTAFYLLLMLAL